MKSNIKKEKAYKPTIKERIGNALFSEIVAFMLDCYEKSKEKDTMSFEDYARYLVDLSNKKIRGEVIVEPTDENLTKGD